MNIPHVAREITAKERHDRSTIAHLHKCGRLSDTELEASIMDHDYHYDQLFRLIWEECSWEEQIQLALQWKHNRFFQSFLDSVQFTAYKILL